MFPWDIWRFIRSIVAIVNFILVHNPSSSEAVLLVTVENLIRSFDHEMSYIIYVAIILYQAKFINIGIHLLISKASG